MREYISVAATPANNIYEESTESRRDDSFTVSELSASPSSSFLGERDFDRMCKCLGHCSVIVDWSNVVDRVNGRTSPVLHDFLCPSVDTDLRVVLCSRE